MQEGSRFDVRNWHKAGDNDGASYQPRVTHSLALGTTAGASSSSVCDAVRTVLATNGRGRQRAVAVGFEPTNGLPRYTLSSSENQGSATVVGVRRVLNEPIAAGAEPARSTTNETKTETK
jgi:hypothetical protein